MKKFLIYLLCFLFLDISQSIAMTGDKEVTGDENKSTSLIPPEKDTNNEATAIIDKVETDAEIPTTTSIEATPGNQEETPLIKDAKDGNMPAPLAQIEEDGEMPLSSEIMNDNDGRNSHIEQKQEEGREFKSISCLFYATIPPTRIRRLLASIPFISRRLESTVPISKKKYKILLFTNYEEPDSAEGIHLTEPESILDMHTINIWPELGESDRFKELLEEIKKIQSKTGNIVDIKLEDINNTLSSLPDKREEIFKWFTSASDISQSKSKSKSKNKNKLTGSLTERELREFKFKGLDIKLPDDEKNTQFEIFKNYVRERTPLNTQQSDTGDESSPAEDIDDYINKTSQPSIAQSQTVDTGQEPEETPPENLEKVLSDLEQTLKEITASNDELAEKLSRTDSGSVFNEQQEVCN